MADSFLLEIVTPTRKLLSREVDEVTAPGELGEFGVLAGHTPYLTLLRPGAVSYKAGGQTERIAVGVGYAEVSYERTTILVDHAESAGEVDLHAAKEALANAEEELKGLGPEGGDRGPGRGALGGGVYT
jgi:F-type H+-transporting ATPase subunit epsilon